MTLEDVKNYIIRKNLNSKSNKRHIVDERAYLYAYIYHFLKIDNLSRIGEMFGQTDENGNRLRNEKGNLIKAKDHATVRHALIKVTDIQFQDSFIENTKELHNQIPIIIPEYKNKIRNVGRIPNVKKKGKQYEITIKVNKEQFYEYARKQDPKVIFDFLFKHMLDAAPKMNKSRNPYKKSINDESGT